MRAHRAKLANTDTGGTSALLRCLTRASGPTVVLFLHGGRSSSVEPMKPWRLAYLRMWWLALRIRRAVRATPGVGVWLLRNRVRGWNEPTRDPLVDAHWALAEIRTLHPEANVVLIGHSMGGRAALLLGAEPGISGVCALAPWVADSDPRQHLENTAVLLAHGDRDRTTSAAASKDYADEADRVGHDVRFRSLSGCGHAMLRHHRRWDHLVRTFVTELLGNLAHQDGTGPSPE
ncbi:Alpha/beta hydrolase family protein [Actinopolyspora saharensis]|uniref:Alpha/beta hydrolase family protein n=1 Tax=Actinopolyspora saharensis TaxID=995062 RepID=A0A1H1D898_9ACTN|nr:Alpha/beta hydrolase family protein [Actinopolyspora saharensis]